MTAPHLALAVDIGGTFTDVVVLDQETGRFHAHKELTTPDNPARGAVTGIARLFAREGLAYAAVGRIVHATTLFTNALIERRGARTGLITTAGFRDTLEIGHERKYELYDLHLPLPEPLVRRRLRQEAVERIGPDGSVEQPLDAGSVRDAAARLIGNGVESLAVVFLHAYANPAHEQEAARILAEAHPGLPVSLSSHVAPQIREYDRTSTTVANAYVKPLADAYLGRLSADLRELGLGAPLFMMLSNGGLTHLDEARRVPVQLLESGPAAGGLAAAVFGARSGLRDLLAFDMGGTTAKLCVVQDGEPLIAHRFEAGRERRFTRGSGVPLAISTVELIEIGAGGGSIARLDALGLLKVGPRSAGSEPGPACYARGGSAPTVTDANLMLGLLDAESFAGGTMRLDNGAATRVVGEVAEAGGLDLSAAAAGIHAVVNETMAAAARVHVAEHGRDARDFALLVTGGGGPLHGCEVARRLGIRRVICPPAAGVASALGLLLAPARVDRVGTLARELDRIALEALEAAFRQLEEEAGAVVAATVGQAAPRRIRRSADMRFIGQGYEITAPLPDGPYGAGARDRLREAFLAAYDTVFTRRPPVHAVEVVNIRVSVSAEPPGREFAPEIETGRVDPAERRLCLGREEASLPVVQRRRLGPGMRLRGPALVEDGMSTLVLPPGAEALMEDSGNLVVTLVEARTGAA